MPLERYITNFVSEIPVPPKGLVQVQITFPEDIHTIFRPPKNTFSLVDVRTFDIFSICISPYGPLWQYSFRPLFRTLDINNILTIFTCIILEYKVSFHPNRCRLPTLMSMIGCAVLQTYCNPDSDCRDTFISVVSVFVARCLHTGASVIHVGHDWSSGSVSDWCARFNAESNVKQDERDILCRSGP